MGCIVQVCITD